MSGDFISLLQRLVESVGHGVDCNLALTQLFGEVTGQHFDGSLYRSIRALF